MSPPTRLDPLLQVRARAEEQARRALSDTIEARKKAESEVDIAVERVFNDTRTASAVDSWMMADLAHARALMDLAQAQDELKEKQKHENIAQQVHKVAQQQLKAIDRAVQTRREDIEKEQARAEQKSFDDTALMLLKRPRALAS